MGILSTVIVIVAVAALWHFVYETILLPSIRLLIRNKLFGLRDRTRNLLLSDLGSEEKKVCRWLHDSITVSIDKVHLMNLDIFYELEQELKHNQKLKDQVSNRIKTLSAVNNSEVKLIDKEFTDCFILGIGANAGGWLPILFPMLLFRATMRSGKKAAKEVSMMPKYEVDRLVPA